MANNIMHFALKYKITQILPTFFTSVVLNVKDSKSNKDFLCTHKVILLCNSATKNNILAPTINNCKASAKAFVRVLFCAFTMWYLCSKLLFMKHVTVC